MNHQHPSNQGPTGKTGGIKFVLPAEAVEPKLNVEYLSDAPLPYGGFQTRSMDQKENAISRLSVYGNIKRSRQMPSFQILEGPSEETEEQQPRTNDNRPCPAVLEFMELVNAKLEGTFFYDDGALQLDFSGNATRDQTAYAHRIFFTMHPLAECIDVLQHSEFCSEIDEPLYGTLLYDFSSWRNLCNCVNKINCPTCAKFDQEMHEKDAGECLAVRLLHRFLRYMTASLIQHTMPPLAPDPHPSSKTNSEEVDVSSKDASKASTQQELDPKPLLLIFFACRKLIMWHRDYHSCANVIDAFFLLGDTAIHCLSRFSLLKKDRVQLIEQNSVFGQFHCGLILKAFADFLCTTCDTWVLPAALYEEAVVQFILCHDNGKKCFAEAASVTSHAGVVMVRSISEILETRRIGDKNKMSEHVHFAERTIITALYYYGKSCDLRSLKWNARSDAVLPSLTYLALLYAKYRIFYEEKHILLRQQDYLVEAVLLGLLHALEITKLPSYAEPLEMCGFSHNSELFWSILNHSVRRKDGANVALSRATSSPDPSHFRNKLLKLCLTSRGAVILPPLHPSQTDRETTDGVCTRFENPSSREGEMSEKPCTVSNELTGPTAEGFTLRSLPSQDSTQVGKSAPTEACSLGPKVASSQDDSALQKSAQPDACILERKIASTQDLAPRDRGDESESDNATVLTESSTTADDGCLVETPLSPGLASDCNNDGLSQEHLRALVERCPTPDASTFGTSADELGGHQRC